MTKEELKKAIFYLNRYTGTTEREQVQGERWLKWIYGSPLGRLSLFLLVKRGIFSRIYGALKSRPSSRKDIAPFVSRFGIDMSESLKSIDEFRHFNDFFYRKLKPGARPVPKDEDQLVFPADARHMGWQNASEMTGVFVKGQSFDLPRLLDCEELAARYENGTIVLSRLCPTDYHRFHFPCDGVPGVTRPVKGPLASVSPYALRRRLAWLWTNKRAVTIIKTRDLGKVTMLEVGATNVGSIIQTYHPTEQVGRGNEKGYFAYGGSTVMTFFEPGRVNLCKDLQEATKRGLELYARQGDAMGSKTIPSDN